MAVMGSELLYNINWDAKAYSGRWLVTTGITPTLSFIFRSPGVPPKKTFQPSFAPIASAGNFRNAATAVTRNTKTSELKLENSGCLVCKVPTSPFWKSTHVGKTLPPIRF